MMKIKLNRQLSIAINSALVFFIFLHSSTKAQVNLGPNSGTSGGNSNTFIGEYSGNSNTSGSYNSVLGQSSLRANTTGAFNSSFGNEALRYSNASGNSAFGYQALYANTTGNYNAGFGHSALKNNTTGGFSVAMGYKALFSNTTGGQNIGLGYMSLHNNTSGSQNIAFGQNSLSTNTTGVSNIAIGSFTLGGTNYNGNYNIAIGSYAMSLATSGSGNIAIGVNSLNANTTGTNNIGIGQQALNANTTGQNNISLGAFSLKVVTTGTGNTGVGVYALTKNTTGIGNLALGYAALSENLTGGSNVAVGDQAGKNSLGSGNIFLGYQAGLYETGSNKLYIANSSTATPLIFGDFTSSYVKINGNLGIGVATPSSKLHTSGTVRFEAITNNNTHSRVLVTDANGNLYYRDASSIGSSGSSYWQPASSDIYYSTGNVGIGINTVPTGYKLAVAGNIITEKLKVKLLASGWPDYVFDPSYKLLPLRDLELFILKNGHLPEIPSAREAEANGLDVGDGHKALLKKIEELTLYIIEQDKKISALQVNKQAVEDLKSEIEELKKLINRD